MLKNRATMLFDFLKWGFQRLPLIITVATFKMKEPKPNTSFTTEKPTTQPHQTISETYVFSSQRNCVFR